MAFFFHKQVQLGFTHFHRLFQKKKKGITEENNFVEPWQGGGGETEEDLWKLFACNRTHKNTTNGHRNSVKIWHKGDIQSLGVCG